MNSSPTINGTPNSHWKILPTVILGHLAVVLFAFAFWNFKSEGIFEQLGRYFYLTAREKQTFLEYGVGLPLLLLLALHAAAWRLSRERRNYRAALAALCAALWPVLLILICYLDFFTPLNIPLSAGFALRIEPLEVDLLLLLLIAAFALCAGTLTQAYLQFANVHAGFDSPASKTAAQAPEQNPAASARFWFCATLAAALLYTIYFGYYTVQRFRSGQANLHDFSLYDQMLWNLLHGNGFRCTLWQSEVLHYDLKQFGYDFSAEHFMPALLLLLPAFALFQHAATLLIAQAFALGGAAIPVYFIALNKLRAPRAAFVFSLAWLLHPIVQLTNMKEFHQDAFIPLYLLGAYALLLYRRNYLYWIGLTLALGCKEDVALSVTFFGLFLMLGERRWKIGGATLLAGLLYGYLVIQILIPHWRDGEPLRQLYRFQQLLPPEQQADPDHLMTPADLLKACLLHPLHVFAQTADQQRWISLLKLGAPFALLMLCSGWIALWALPPLASTLLSNWDTQYTLALHYGIAIVPPFIAASIWGLARWANLHKTEIADLPDVQSQAADPGAQAASPATGTSRLRESSAANTRARLAGGTIAVLAGALLTQYYFGFLPGCERFPKDDFAVTDHVRKLQPFIAVIPPDARLSATVCAGTFAAHRESIYLFPELQDANFILIDTRGPEWPISRDELKRRTLDLLNSPDWGLKLPYRDGYLLLEKGFSTDSNAATAARLSFREKDQD